MLLINDVFAESEQDALKKLFATANDLTLNVFLLMTLTSPNCPSAEFIPSEVKEKIQQIEGINNVEVEVTFEPPYTQDMMSEVAKLELGFL